MSGPLQRLTITYASTVLALKLELFPASPCWLHSVCCQAIAHRQQPSAVPNNDSGHFGWHCHAIGHGAQSAYMVITEPRAFVGLLSPIVEVVYAAPHQRCCYTRTNPYGNSRYDPVTEARVVSGFINPTNDIAAQGTLASNLQPQPLSCSVGAVP